MRGAKMLITGKGHSNYNLKHRSFFLRRRETPRHIAYDVGSTVNYSRIAKFLNQRNWNMAAYGTLYYTLTQCYTGTSRHFKAKQDRSRSSCHAMSCHIMSCHVMSCHAMSYKFCPVKKSHAMSCHAMTAFKY